MDLGKRIAKLRESTQMTQEKLAKKLFVSDKTISSWEAGRTEPSLEFILKMSEIFSCSVSFLVYENEKKSDIETEIKIQLTLKEYENLEIYLNAHANFITEIKQEDCYYQPNYRNFVNEEKIKNKEKISEWLRIGKRGNKTILNYKNWYNSYCDEYEVEIDNSINLDKIFSVLGIEKLVNVEKIRKTYFYLDKYEIALDAVKDLGYFVEIEVKKYAKTPLEEYDALLKVAKDLNLNLDHIDKRGYPYYMVQNKYQKNT